VSYLSLTQSRQRKSLKRPYGSRVDDLITLNDRLRMVPTDTAALQLVVTELRASEDPTDRRRLGVGLIALGQYSEAVVVLDLAVRDAVSITDPHAEVASRINLGDAFRYHGDLQAALTEYQRALAVARAEVAELLDFALQHLGKHYLDAGRPNDASDCLTEALTLRKAKGDLELIASTEAALALVLSTGR
jgi:tetratricopeptide (TPR) repeat protein